jgi:hypothetical protein
MVNLIYFNIILKFFFSIQKQSETNLLEWFHHNVTKKTFKTLDQLNLSLLLQLSWSSFSSSYLRSSWCIWS